MTLIVYFVITDLLFTLKKKIKIDFIKKGSFSIVGFFINCIIVLQRTKIHFVNIPFYLGDIIFFSIA